MYILLVYERIIIIIKGSCLGPFYSRCTQVNSLRLLRTISQIFMLTLMTPRNIYLSSRTLLLVGVPSTQLSKLQRLQNAAARLVSNVEKYDHITPTLVHLHWLQVTYRVNFKIAILAHKCIYGNAPEYLKDLIKVKGTTRYNLRSDG